MKWHCIYDLSQDHRRVKRIQKATLETEDMGLLPEIALFGSNEWWNAIKDGRIPKLELSGIISKVNDISRGAWPMCVIDANGEKTEWTRYGDDTLYKAGRGIRLEYVYQKWKPSKTNKSLGDKVKVVLKVMIEF